MAPFVQLAALDVAGTCAHVEGDHLVPYPGVAETIAELRAQGIRVALLACDDSQRRALDDLGWRLDGSGIVQVDALVLASEMTENVPSPQMIHTAMARTGVHDVRRVVAVGDSENDMRAACNSGGLAVGVLTGGACSDDLTQAGADDVLDSVADLPHWLATTKIRPPMPAA